MGAERTPLRLCEDDADGGAGLELECLAQGDAVGFGRDLGADVFKEREDLGAQICEDSGGTRGG